MPEHIVPAPRAFWRCLPASFAFALQLRPLAYAILLAGASLFLQLLYFFPKPVALLVVQGGIAVAATRYAFKVMAMGSLGIFRATDFPRSLDDEWKYLPWKLLALTMVQGLLFGVIALKSERLGYALGFLAVFTLPAAAIVLLKSGSFFAALNPIALLEVILAFGWSYLLLCLILGLLQVASGFAGAFLIFKLKLDERLALAAVNFVAIYFVWVMASLMGYAMYQNRAGLGIEARPSARAGRVDDDLRSPARAADQQTDELVARMVADGDIAGALRLAYEEQRTHPDDIAAHRRYHRMLLLMPYKQATLLEHAQRLIGMLLSRDLAPEALRIYHACREKDESFVLEDPQNTMVLSRLEWRNGDPKASLALLRGFDKRFKGNAAIPEAYELAARVLVQGLDRRDMAQPILKTLEVRYPNSEQVKEVRWLLREEEARPA